MLTVLLPKRKTHIPATYKFISCQRDIHNSECECSLILVRLGGSKRELFQRSLVVT